MQLSRPRACALWDGDAQALSTQDRSPGRSVRGLSARNGTRDPSAFAAAVTHPGTLAHAATGAVVPMSVPSALPQLGRAGAVPETSGLPRVEGEPSCLAYLVVSATQQSFGPGGRRRSASVTLVCADASFTHPSIPWSPFLLSMRQYESA